MRTPLPPADSLRLVGAGAFLAVVALGFIVVQPFPAAPIGPDAAAPVIEFQRLAAGQRLEGYLSQTSKPLLTVAYGVLHGAVGDWWAVSAATILVYAAFVVLASLLALRISGRAAATFVGFGLALSPALLRDVTQAYGLPWAGLTWAVAGLLVTGARPRYAAAGIALGLGALARPETFAIIAGAVALVAGASIAARVLRRPGPPRSSWLIAIGFGAILVLAVHDWALFGDPLFWLNTAQANSEGLANVRTLAQMILWVGRHAFAVPPVLALAVVAGLVLVVRGRWTDAAVTWLVPLGVAAFFIASGARGTVIATRYLAPVDVGLVFAAGVGLGFLDIPALRPGLDRVRSTRIRAAIAFAFPVLAAVMVVVVLTPTLLRDGETRAWIHQERALHDNARRAFAAIEVALGEVPPWRGQPTPADPAPLVLIPPRLRAQGVVDLDLPLWAAKRSFAVAIDPGTGRPAPPVILYHDALDDKAHPAWAQVEVSEPTTVGQLNLVPILVDPGAGIWVLEIEAAPQVSPTP